MSFPILFLISIVELAAVAEPNNPGTVSLSIHLADFSRVVGKSGLRSLPLHSNLVGKLEIPVANLRSLRFNPDHGSATVTLQNGDQIQEGTINLMTLFGIVSIPLQVNRDSASVGAHSGVENLDLFQRDEGHRTTANDDRRAAGGGGISSARRKCLESVSDFRTPITATCDIALEKKLEPDDYLGDLFISTDEPTATEYK